MIARESMLLQGLLQPKRNPLPWMFHLETQSLLLIPTWTLWNQLQDLLTSNHSAEVDVASFSLHIVLLSCATIYSVRAVQSRVKCMADAARAMSNRQVVALFKVAPLLAVRKTVLSGLYCSSIW